MNNNREDQVFRQNSANEKKGPSDVETLSKSTDAQ